MQLGGLSAELLLQIVEYLNDKDLSSLLRTNRSFARILTPKIHKLALEDKDEMPALFWAAARGHEPLVNFLLGKITNIKDNGMEVALNFAASFGHVEIVRLLLNKGVGIESYGLDGSTALHEAALFGQEEMVRFLLGNGANVESLDVRKRTPLHCAVGAGPVVVHLMLIELGVDNPWKLDERLRKEIWQLADNRAGRTVGALLENGANIYAQEEGGNTPLHTAIISVGDDEGEFMGFTTFKLVCGANVDTVNYRGDTALYLATIFAARVAFKFLVDSGADISRRSEDGQTPLHDAVESANFSYQAVTLLLENGADIEARDTRGQTALHFVFGSDAFGDHPNNKPNPDIISLLLKWGANINSSCNQGFTALHKAVMRQSQECVKVLLDGGADIHTENMSGNTPLDLTQLNPDRRIIKLLSDAGLRTPNLHNRLSGA